MKTIIQEEGKLLVALFDGRLDTAAADQTKQDLLPLKGCEGRDIVLDCAKLNYISSSGLRLFLTVLKDAKPKGSHVYLRNVSDHIRDVFTMTGFFTLFEFM